MLMFCSGPSKAIHQMALLDWTAIQSTVYPSERAVPVKHRNRKLKYKQRTLHKYKTEKLNFYSLRRTQLIKDYKIFIFQINTIL